MSDTHVEIATIASNLRAVRARIDDSCRAVGRNSADITLIAVGKFHPAASCRAAIAAGQRDLGENRVQEAAVKWPALRSEFPEIRLHLIGPLQTNKVKEAVSLFDVIQSIDRPKLAVAVAEQMAKQGRRPACLIQVNTGEEDQKAGLAPAEADSFIAQCRDGLGLPILGLMCIPPADEPPSLHFALLREIARRNQLSALSMGMSADYEDAIRFGATHVRVGTAIFGARPAPA